MCDYRALIRNRIQYPPLCYYDRTCMHTLTHTHCSFALVFLREKRISTRMFHSRSLLVLAVVAAAPLSAYSASTCFGCGEEYYACNAPCMGDTSCLLQCNQYWNMRLMNLGCPASSSTSSGSSGAGSAPLELTDAQMDIVAQCSDALDAVNTQGLNFISSAKLEAQANLWAESVCPDTLSPNGVMDISEYTDVGVFFQSISCALCTGLINPSSIQGDNDSCGCNGPSSAAPSISINDLTGLEAVMYCTNVAELVVTECAQPKPSCYQGLP